MRLLSAVGCALAVALSAGVAGNERTCAAAERTFIADGEPARMRCGAPPAGWHRPELDDRDWPARVTVVERRDGGAPYEVEPLDGGAPPCSGARFGRWHFSVGSDVGKLQSVTLRIRYSHGFAAYLNGVEIARRRLDANAPAEGLATDVHGPEYESFVVSARALRRGDNVLAVEVHPRTAGRDTTVELSLRGEDAPRFIRGPYLLGVGERGAVLVFDTDVPTAAEVEWGASDDYGASARAAFGTHHVVHLERLKPGAVYHYRVRARSGIADSTRSPESTGSPESTRSSESTRSPESTRSRDSARAQRGLLTDSGDVVFHTPPDGGRPLRFAVYGDVRSGHDVHAALNRALTDEQPDLAILTGDLVDRGSDEGDWERFFEIAGPLLRSLAIFPAIGNHEYAARGKGLVAFMQYFRWPQAPADDEPPWYSFDVGAAHFVALDSNSYKSPRQLSWFDHDLREARRRGARALFVYAHEGPASSGMHGDNAVCARDYIPIMERNHVSMFFGGHDHDYERGKIGGVDYVVTGGGGAELRAARCGVPGKRACPPRVAAFVNDHNYVMVELLPSLFRVCPKRVDGTPLEACVQYPLR